MADKSSQHYSQTDKVPLRKLIQVGFVLGSILTGIQFHRFVMFLVDAAPTAVAQRPAEVEAWLPISSFMSLVYLVRTGIANTVHPAGLVFFTLILALTLFMRRGFCSWICPVGTLSEYAHLAGRRLFKRNFCVPKPLDITLRSIKYLLLSFFAVVICKMSADNLGTFIHSPYNRICDIKMYMMFANVTATTLIFIGALGILSLLFKNFLCRYLCPYGAVLGLAAIPSPTAIRRDADLCTKCEECSRVCPNGISVHTSKAVRSPECTACYECVAACPQPGALYMGLAQTKETLTLSFYGIIIIVAFVFVPQIFRAFSYWDTDTPLEIYRRLFAAVSEMGHPDF